MVVARVQGYRTSLMATQSQSQSPAATASSEAEAQAEARRVSQQKADRAAKRRGSLLRRRQSTAALRNARVAQSALAARQQEEREELELQLLEAQARARAAESGTESSEEDEEGGAPVALQAVGGGAATEAHRRMQGRKSLQWLSGWVKGEGAARVAELSVGDEKEFAQDFARDLLAACANASEDDDCSEYSDDDDDDYADFDEFWGNASASSEEDEDGASRAPSWRGVKGWTLHGDELNTYFFHERSGTTVMRYATEGSADEDGDAAVATSYYYSNPESGESSWEPPSTELDTSLGDWVMLQDAGHHTYYYNPITEVSTWERPDMRNVDSPDNWEAYRDEWGRTYYHNA